VPLSSLATHKSSEFPTLEQSLKVEADCLEVSSPSLSVASWSDLNAVYQENSATTLEVVNNVLNSPHNTWNYPSPGSPRLQYPPSSTSSPVIPWSPTVAASPEFIVPGFPFLAPTGPGPYNVYIPQSPQYSTLSASTSITLANPDTLEPTPIDLNPYVVRSPSPSTSEPTEEALHAAAKFDLRQLGEENAAHVVRLAQAELDSLLPPLTQDSWSHLQLTGDLVDHISLEDIPLKNIPPPVFTAPIAAIPSPALSSPAPLPVQIFHPTVDVGPFEYLFAAPPCLPANGHPHQYMVHYKQGCHIWFLSEELVNSQFLSYIPWAQDLNTAAPPYFVTPFRADAHHSIHVHSDGTLPLVHICAKVGKHLWSPKFPFGYIETTFLDSIKFVFSRFPPLWLTHFEGALVPLVVYDFLDGRTAILCGHLHFTKQGILFINRSMRIMDLLRTDPQFSCFVPTPHVPAKPFDFITPPSDDPL